MRLDRYGRQQLTGVDDGHHERTGPDAEEGTVVRTAAAPEPVPSPIGSQRGDEDDVGVGDRQHLVTTVDAELQIPVGQDGRQQDANPTLPQSVQCGSEVRLAAHCRISRDDASRGDFGDGKHGVAQPRVASTVRFSRV